MKDMNMKNINSILDEIIDKRKSESEDIEISLNKARELGQEQEIKAVKDKWEAEEINALIKDYVALENLKPVISKYYELIKETVEKLESKLGVNGSFQDEAGIVYVVEESTGKFVSFDRFTIHRTRKNDEVRGSLSQARALEFGFSSEVGKIEFKKAFKGYENE